MKKAAISLLLAGLVLAGCGSSSSSSSSSATSSAAATSSSAAATPVAAKTSCPHTPVRFAVEPYDTGPALEKAYGSLATDISQKLGCKVQLIISNSYVAEIEAMRGGQLEMGEFGPLGYVLAHKIAGAQPIAAFGDKTGHPDTYTAGIWVKKSSPIISLTQLKGKTGKTTAASRRARCAIGRRSRSPAWACSTRPGSRRARCRAGRPSGWPSPARTASRRR
jgi:ABC-type phosphate/phosphonate transport system substrate-binding protein